MASLDLSFQIRYTYYSALSFIIKMKSNINQNGHFEHFWDKGRLEGIKNFPKNMKIANFQVLLGMSLLLKIRQF